MKRKEPLNNQHIINRLHNLIKFKQDYAINHNIKNGTCKNVINSMKRMNDAILYLESNQEKTSISKIQKMFKIQCYCYYY